MSDRKVNHRLLAERLLAQSFIGTVKKVATGVNLRSKYNRQTVKKGGTESPGLSDFEQSVFSKYTYYGWVPAVLSGFATFCCLFGAMRFASYRSSIRHKSLPSSASYHTRTSQKRHEYRSLDSPGGGSGSTPTKAIAAEVTPKFNLFSDEIVVQVQFLFVSAIALFVATSTGNITMDRLGFYRNLAEVPLQPGKSVLCYEMCPVLMKRRTALGDMQSMADIYKEREEGDEKLQEMDEETVLSFKPDDLWQDPHGEDLEQIVRLVQNCSLRTNFESECRKRDNHRVDPADGLVDVPTPGVPVNFIVQDDNQ